MAAEQVPQHDVLDIDDVFTRIGGSFADTGIFRDAESIDVPQEDAVTTVLGLGLLDNVPDHARKGGIAAEVPRGRWHLSAAKVLRGAHGDGLMRVHGLGKVRDQRVKRVSKFFGVDAIECSVIIADAKQNMRCRCNGSNLLLHGGFVRRHGNGLQVVVKDACIRMPCFVDGQWRRRVLKPWETFNVVVFVIAPALGRLVVFTPSIGRLEAL